MVMNRHMNTADLTSEKEVLEYSKALIGPFVILAQEVKHRDIAKKRR